MKTIFLISVLFIMLTFAFKGPDQSAWDFARQVFSKVSYTLGSEVNNPNNLEAVRRLEQNFEFYSTDLMFQRMRELDEV